MVPNASITIIKGPNQNHIPHCTFSSPFQDYFWTFCLKTWKDNEIEITEENVQSQALMASKAYVAQLRSTGLLPSE